MDHKEFNLNYVQINKKANVAIWLSSFALLMCVGFLALWIIRVKEFSVVSLDSFIGIAVALLTILVTIVLGWQIFTAIDIKEKVSAIDQLQKALTTQEHKMEQMYCNNCRINGYTMAGLAEGRDDYVDSFRWILSSLRFSLLQDSPTDIEQMLFDLQRCVSSVPEGTFIDKMSMNEIYEHDTSIRKQSVFGIIESRYEPVFSGFVKKVVVEK